jgi:cobyrinic acid a,c-diamide synthase
MARIPRVAVAAPSSGCGKTTISTGIMSAFAERYNVQGFKIGPDYIDPSYHTAATGRVSRNLDTWMLSAAQVKRIFALAQHGADVCVIEGVMGLFDGYDGLTERGSTAEASKILSAPVILVINAEKVARSAAAIALGFRDFDPAVSIAGVIVNNVGSERHARWVTEAIEAIGMQVIGCVPRMEKLNVPERHLGLFIAEERSAATNLFVQEAASVVKKYVDMEKVFAIAESAPDFEFAFSESPATPQTTLRIAVARDEAFCFYYEDNLDLLRDFGAEIVFFSPLRDAELPPNISGIYLGGGYPELYASQLAANSSLRAAIKEAARRHIPIYAECGGLMFLTRHFENQDGQKFPMLDIISGHAQMSPRLTLGYREAETLRDNILLPKGATIRGHEFHYSEWIRLDENSSPAYAIKSRDKNDVQQEGFADDHILASYVHVHFESNPSLAQNFVNACQKYKKENYVA